MEGYKRPVPPPPTRAASRPRAYRDRFGVRHLVGAWRGGWAEFAQAPADREPVALHYANIYPTRQAAEDNLAYWADVYQWKEE